jgi:hypothetical protein
MREEVVMSPMFQSEPAWFWLSVAVSVIGISLFLWPTLVRVVRSVAAGSRKTER